MVDIRPYTSYCEPEILRLYNSVGWISYTSNPTALRSAFQNSLLTLAAYHNDTLLGILRCVGDGISIVYLQDLLVFPQHQRKGVGSALVHALLERFESVRQIVLITDDTSQTTAFYRAIGFLPLCECNCRGFIRWAKR